ncbi:hypothetical protein G3I13_09385 [Streptomyces sp. SID6673]|nr:hypothetical protein [Streptomyces sp. SID11726]NEB24541.1 hypothetical protein [Streptomyces sp. SID6673]
MSHAPMIPSTNALERVVESGRLVALVDPSSPARAELDVAVRRYGRPLQVQVGGRPGTGRDTFARALRERLSVTAIGPGEADGNVDAPDPWTADLWMYVLSGPPRAADRTALAQMPADRTVVVLGKADTHGSPEAAADVAAECAQHLGVPVQAVSQLLACADLSDDEFDLLRRLVAAGQTMPSMSGQFLTPTLTGQPVADGAGPFRGDERVLRAGLLRRVDRRGIEVALDLLAADDQAAADVSALNTALHGRSGIDQLVTSIRERVDLVRYWRLTELRSRLEIVAARGWDRDVIEQLLRDGEVA